MWLRGGAYECSSPISSRGMCLCQCAARLALAPSFVPAPLLLILHSSAEGRRREAGPRRVRHLVEEGATISGKNSAVPPDGDVRSCDRLTEGLFVLPQSIYKKNDSDNSGTMSTPEMRVAFKDAGRFLLLLF